jgi:hypothetical protein
MDGALVIDHRLKPKEEVKLAFSCVKSQIFVTYLNSFNDRHRKCNGFIKKSIPSHDILL